MISAAQIIAIAKVSGILKRIKRTGWVRIGISNVESVAEHVYRTALLCSLLTQDKKINHKKLLEMALIHDIGETVTSDIRWEEGKKVVGSESAKRELESGVIQEVFRPLDVGEYYINLWKEFDTQSSSEAKLLKQIEKIEMAIQALEYEEVGNDSDSLNQFFENADKYVKDADLKKLLKSVIKLRKKRS